MTYLQFHLFFNLPMLVLLLVLARKRLRGAFWGALGITSAIVMLAASPWDLWAVHRGIWSFDWGRTTPLAFEWGGVTWRLPAEEYAFFLVETLLVGLVVLLTLPAGAIARLRGGGR